MISCCFLIAFLHRACSGRESRAVQADFCCGLAEGKAFAYAMVDFFDSFLGGMLDDDREGRGNRLRAIFF